MSRKFAAAAATTLGLAMTLGLAGLSAADDEKPLEKGMEKVNAKFNMIKKATRSAATWKKDGPGVPKAAEEISKIGKQFRTEKAPAEAQKKTVAEWTKLMDDMIVASDEMAVLAAKTSTTQPQAKDAWTKLNKTCADCHTVFRVDEEK